MASVSISVRTASTTPALSYDSKTVTGKSEFDWRGSMVFSTFDGWAARPRTAHQGRTPVDLGCVGSVALADQIDTVRGSGHGVSAQVAVECSSHTEVYFPFLDEAPEYQRRILDALREPLESGELVLHRAAGTATYPARFQLVLAANPCPCGLATGKGMDCSCSAQQRRRYFDRMSGPLLDRVDLQMAVHRVSLKDFSGTDRADSSAAVASRVAAARGAQRERLVRWQLSTNAEVPATLLHNELRLTRKTTEAVDRKMEQAAITKRGYDRVLRVAWTIADLAGRPAPTNDDVTTALLFRTQERAA